MAELLDPSSMLSCVSYSGTKTEGFGGLPRWLWLPAPSNGWCKKTRGFLFKTPTPTIATKTNPNVLVKSRLESKISDEFELSIFWGSRLSSQKSLGFYLWEMLCFCCWQAHCRNGCGLQETEATAAVGIQVVGSLYRLTCLMPLVELEIWIDLMLTWAFFNKHSWWKTIVFIA